MPTTKSAKKEIRVAERRRLSNRSTRSQCKTYITRAERLISSGEPEPAQKAVVAAISALDKAAAKGMLHPNNAARHKSRLMKQLNQALPSAKPS